MIDYTDLQGFDISDKRAAVLGVGGLGCNIAVHLACAGIGELILCDFDTVSETNLNRQFLYTHADIGKEKAPLAKARLEATAPNTKITAVNKKIESPADLDFARDADIFFLAVDNNAARAAAQEFCREHKMPLVNGGVNRFHGSAYLWDPGESPDLTAAGLLTAETKRLYPVSSTVGIIGALEAQLGIRYLLGDNTVAGTLYVLTCETIDALPLL